MYTLTWSVMCGGGWNLQPFPQFNSLPERRKQFLKAISKTPGKSIYEIAKTTGIQYRRAHDHATKLIADGMVQVRLVVENGKRKTKLYPKQLKAQVV